MRNAGKTLSLIVSGTSRNGGYVQYKPHEDANKREHAPQQRKGMAQGKPEVHGMQEDQWAVLRHEVEDEDMKWQDERDRPVWEQRDTEDDAITSQASSDAEFEESLNHVDIVVAGIGGAGMNAVNRMINRNPPTSSAWDSIIPKVWVLVVMQPSAHVPQLRVKQRFRQC